MAFLTQQFVIFVNLKKKFFIRFMHHLCTTYSYKYFDNSANVITDAVLKNVCVGRDGNMGYITNFF